jgi:hypothetical protein
MLGLTRRGRVVLAGLLAAAMAFVGCRYRSGVFDATSFKSRLYPYTVHYGDPDQHALISQDWVVENYLSDSDGRPTTPKQTKTYQKVLDLELANGQTVNESFDVYDLLLVHSASDAEIWLRAIPISPRRSGRSLHVVAEQYAEGLSGSGFFKSDLGRIAVESQTYAGHVLASRPVTVAGLEALETTVEVANVDQLRLDPKSRSAQIRVVFVRTPFTTKSEYPTRRVPIMLMIGYANNPTDFDAQSADFDRFLGLIEVNGSRGFQVLETAATAPSASASAPAGSSAPDSPAPSAVATSPLAPWPSPPPPPAPSASGLAPTTPR